MQTTIGRRKPTKRLLGAAAVIGLLSSAGIMAAAPAALAKIVIGQSIAGVKLGDTEAQVRRLVGKPFACEPCSMKEKVWRYERGFEGVIAFDSHGRLQSMWTGSKKQKTSKGIHANGFSFAGHPHGSSLAEIKKAYPSAKCTELPNSNGFAYCDLTSHYHGRKVDTDFLIKVGSAGVAEIAIGFV